LNNIILQFYPLYLYYFIIFSKLYTGTAFIVYEDIYDAKSAVDHLSGFNVGGRYLVVLYYQPAKFEKRATIEERQREVEELRKQVKMRKAAIAAEEENVSKI